jgi:transposase
MSKTVLADWLIAKRLKIGNRLATKRMQLEVERTATTKTNKPRRVKGYTQKELFNFCGPLQPTPVYAAQSWINTFNAAEDTDLKVLFLPVAHPQLNPIELAWNSVKNHAAKHNLTWRMGGVKEAVEEGRDAYTAAAWRGACAKADSFGRDCLRLDAHIEAVPDHMEVLPERVGG